MSKEKVLGYCYKATQIITETIHDGGRWPTFNDYLFTEEEWNGDSVYALEKLSGSIRYSMTLDTPEDDPVWEKALEVFGDYFEKIENTANAGK